MKDLLHKFESRRPEIAFEWKDAETEAEGWVVINSLRGGAAGGGRRMRQGLDKCEVEALAKTMEIKFTVSGPTGLDADEKISVIPDFIANCGMPRVFAYFMETEAAMDDASIFNDISNTIRTALQKTKNVNPSKTKIAQASFEIALKQLV
jgi:glutamate dehydrogenase/leucine dehydrogenase